MSSWKILSIALLSVSLTAACAKKEGADATLLSSADEGRVALRRWLFRLPQAPQKDLVVSVGDRIFFDFDSSSRARRPEPVFGQAGCVDG